MRAISVLLPTLGNPTSATSAINFNSRLSHRSSPTSPCSAKEGARRRLDRKRALPRPPWPPRPASQRSPSATRSASSSPSRSRTTVPSGTRTSRSAPRRPWRPLPCPWVPSPPRRWGWSRKASREATLRSATSHTSPPEPPSPPSGPPRATCASRRNATAPAPPSPAFTCSCASSTNPGTGRYQGWGKSLAIGHRASRRWGSPGSGQPGAWSAGQRPARRPAAGPCGGRT